MIVLDATNKSLKIQAPIGISSVISYWSIVSDVWTPHSFEADFSVSGLNVILPAPIVGETKVVENIWVRFASALVTSNLEIHVVAGATTHIIASINGGTVSVGTGTIFTLGRDGMFTRQSPSMQGTTLSENVH